MCNTVNVAGKVQVKWNRFSIVIASLILMLLTGCSSTTLSTSEKVSEMDQSSVVTIPEQDSEKVADAPARNNYNRLMRRGGGVRVCRDTS